MILAPDCCYVTASGYQRFVALPMATAEGMIRARGEGDGWISFPTVYGIGNGDPIQVLPQTFRRRNITGLAPAWWRDADEAMDFAREVAAVRLVNPELFEAVR